MNIIVNSLLIHYEKHGVKGKTVILLHGWGDNLSTFQTLSAILGKKYEVIAADLPGFGQSQTPSVPWGLTEYAQFVKDFLSKLNVEPYAVLGHSNGGAISIKAVSKGFISPKKLILLSSAGVRSRSSFKKATLQVVAKTGKVVTAPLPKRVQQSLRKKLYGTIGSDYLVAPHLEETFKRVTNEDVQMDAVTISTPTLILNGVEDDATPKEYAILFHKAIENSQLVLIDGVGHFAHQQEPDLVAQKLVDFLK